MLNAPAAGQIWGVGGTVTYPTVGSPIANGTSVTIRRIVPITQTTSISNQGDFYPQVVEAAMDTLCLEIQQIAARTGQLRGAWATGLVYNFGDVVTDGANGNNTGNFYMCAIQNTSGVWATDLAAGDWSLAYIGLTAANIVAVLGYTPMRGSNNLSEITNAPTARSHLGLGNMAVQNSSAITITGGTISGVTITTSNAIITGGSIDNCIIGDNTPAAASFTNLAASGNIAISTNSNSQIYETINGSISFSIAGGGAFSLDTRGGGIAISDNNAGSISLEVNGVGGILLSADSASDTLELSNNGLSIITSALQFTMNTAATFTGGNFVIGSVALATNAVAGFPWIPSCAGTPTGSPVSPYTKAAAIVYDTTAHKLWIRDNTTWKSATFS